jgi:hypothetical protein
MIFVTLILTSSEMERIDQTARQFWPEERGRLSRTEICRRFTLTGCETIGRLPASERKHLREEFRQSVDSEHGFKFRGSLPRAD